jgi:hypothetical protein
MIRMLLLILDLYLFYCQTVRIVFKYMNINAISPDNRC